LSIRFDRALALITLEDYASALEDLQAVWAALPDRQAEITNLIQGNAGLAAYLVEHPAANPAFLAFVTPASLTAVVEAIPTPTLEVVPSPSPVAAQYSTPSPFQDWSVFGYGEVNSREIMIMHPTTDSQQQITNNESME